MHIFFLSIFYPSLNHIRFQRRKGKGKQIELRELRDQLKKKWGPDMTEWTLSGVENQDLKGWYPRATIESSKNLGPKG